MTPNRDREWPRRVEQPAPPRCIRCDAELPDDLPIKHCQSCIDALEPLMSEPARQLWRTQRDR